MISLCTTTVNGDTSFVSVLIESVLRWSPSITEIIVTDLSDKDSEREEMIGQVRCLWMSRPRSQEAVNYYQHDAFGHAISLHQSIDRATQEYVMLCDPDVFFLSDVAGLYLSTMADWNIDFIGIINEWMQCYEYFPCIINCMCKRAYLPHSDFLDGEIMYRGNLYVTAQEWACGHATGKYLLQGPIPRIAGLFPKPELTFDAGCNLWYWGYINKWRWLSFRATADQVYVTKSLNTNFTSGLVMPYQELLYHMRGSAGRNKGRGADFRRMFEGSKNSGKNSSEKPNHDSYIGVQESRAEGL